MARIKKPEDRKILLNIAKKTPIAIQELIRIRGDSTEIYEEFDTFKDSDRTIKLMKKKKATLFISSNDKRIIFGRTYDNQIVDMYKFKVNSMKSSADFEGVPAEICVKYFLLVQNVKDKRLENLMVDMFRQRSYEVDLHGIRYAWILSQNGEIVMLKYVRVLKDYSVEDIGPAFEIEQDKGFGCGEELWEKALNIKKVKKVKNVGKNIFKDKIGKIHIDRQDLKDIKLKKSKGYKNKPISADFQTE